MPPSHTQFCNLLVELYTGKIFFYNSKPIQFLDEGGQKPYTQKTGNHKGLPLHICGPQFTTHLLYLRKTLKLLAFFLRSSAFICGLHFTCAIDLP